GRRGSHGALRTLPPHARGAACNRSASRAQRRGERRRRGALHGMHPRLVTTTMAEQADVRRIVAEVLGVEPASIDAGTPLRLSSSLARARLDAVLRKQLGVKCAAAYTARRFGDLDHALLGEARTDDEPAEAVVHEAADTWTPLEAARTSSAGIR